MNLNTLKTLREEGGLTQQQLADLICKDRSLIAKIENENTFPSVETAKAIGRVLNVNWTIFFENKSEDTSQSLKHSMGIKTDSI